MSWVPRVRDSRTSRLGRNLYFDYRAADWMVSATRPVDDGDVHHLTVGLDILLQELIDRTVTSELGGTYSLIFREDGRLIAHPRFMDAIQARSGALSIQDTGDANLERLYQLTKGRQPGQILVGNPRDNQYLAIQQITGPGWYLVTVFPREIVVNQALKTAELILLLGVIALLVELGILFLALRGQVAAPLMGLIQATRQVASGRFDTSLDVHRDDEIGQLASSFTAMAQEIDSREAALSERSATLARLNAQLESELEERRRAERELARQRELNALLNAIDYGILFLILTCASASPTAPIWRCGASHAIWSRVAPMSASCSTTTGIAGSTRSQAPNGKPSSTIASRNPARRHPADRNHPCRRQGHRSTVR